MSTKLALLFLFVASSPSKSLAVLDECILGDKNSKEFTIAAVRGNRESALKLMSPKSIKDKNKFYDELEQQFKPLLGKEVYHSVSTNGLQLKNCIVEDGIRKFRDHRLLLFFDTSDGKNRAEVLPMKVEVHLIKGLGWRVVSFASTAL